MLLKNGHAFVDRHFVEADIRVTEGVITEIGYDLQAETGEEEIDCSELKIIPGLFDVHTHGCLGHDFSIPDRKGDEEMLRFYAEHGVTSVLATTMTNEPGQYRQACATIGDIISGQDEYTVPEFEVNDAAAAQAGARSEEQGDVVLPSEYNVVSATIRGINAEGPFLSPDKRGAHDPQYLRPIEQDFFDDLQSASGYAIKLVTVAPELDGAMEFIRRNTAKDDASRIYVSLGHSACDYDTAIMAFDCGADHVTHLFNAMNGLGHRAPGIPGAAYDREAYTELICDGLHVHPTTVKMMFNCFPERIVMISDSINPTGLPEGKYSAGGLDVYMKDGEIRLEDGTLAGSSITLFEGLRRVISYGVPEDQAILAATYNPAASVGLADQTGSIAVGRQAELLLVTKSWDIDSVIIGNTTYFSNM